MQLSTVKPTQVCIAQAGRQVISTTLAAPLSTVKKAVELLDVPSRNSSLMLKKYNGNVEFFCLSTYVLFFPLCHRMKKFDIRAV
jgi:hypothetical protein